MADDFEIRNSDGDFAQIQNYVIQLVAEGKLHFSTFVLYAFYRSVAGFSKINFSYEYITKNTSISKGAITYGNKELAENGLIVVKNNGKNRCNTISIVSGSLLPRRQLVKIERDEKSDDSVQNTTGAKNEQSKQKMNTSSDQGSKNVPEKNSTIKNSPNKNNTTTDPGSKAVEQGKTGVEAARFINEFMKYWNHQYKSKKYRKNDLYKVSEIDDFDQAIKMIPVLWCIEDDWVKNSDHSISVFVKEYKSGKLHSTYPNTRYYYQSINK